ncbi:MAG TPA: hypothetical protein VIL46_10640 [Gemmataceae bacterium]
MAAPTLIIALLLIVLGLVGYFGGGRQSVTALIPAFFGLPLAVLGLLALKEHMRKHAMHTAMVVALVGLVGALMRPVSKLARGEALDFTSAPVVSQGLMALLCLVLLVMGVNSFIQARRGRAA